jgi:hypothetical protein
MRRHILRFTFLAILFTFATSAYAQATGADCSTSTQPDKTWNQQPPDAPGTGPQCNGTYQQSFTVYSTTVDTCTNNNTGAVYDQSHPTNDWNWLLVSTDLRGTVLQQLNNSEVQSEHYAASDARNECNGLQSLLLESVGRFRGGDSAMHDRARNVSAGLLAMPRGGVRRWRRRRRRLMHMYNESMS